MPTPEKEIFSSLDFTFVTRLQLKDVITRRD